MHAQTSIKEDRQMGNKYSLGKYKLTTIRYYYAHIRIAKIKIFDNTKCWQGCGSIGSLMHC